MKTSNIDIPRVRRGLAALAICMVLAAVAVAAQLRADPATVPTADHQDASVCWDYAVKYHRAATEVGNPDQASLVIAAEQYEWLEAHHQEC